MRKIFIDLEYYLEFYFNTISYAINLDFDILNKSITTIQKILVFILFFIILFIIIFLSITIIKEERNKKLFGYFSQIPKTNNYY